MRTIEAGGTTLAVREWGEPGSPPLLFWHDAGAGSAQFEQAARVLADEDGLRVVAPDAPGHGASPPLPGGPASAAELAALGAGLLDALGLGAAIWAGYGWGAAVGCGFAAAHPERTRALVLLEGGFGTGPGDAEAAAGYPVLRERSLPVLLVVDRHDHGSPGSDPVERFRAEVPQAQVERVESGHGHDLLGHGARNLARLVGDWLAARDLL